MVNFYEIEERDGVKYLIEKELTLKEEKVLDDDSEEQLDAQIKDVDAKLNKLYAIKEAFEKFNLSYDIEIVSESEPEPEIDEEE